MDSILDLLDLEENTGSCPKCGGAGLYKVTRDGYDYLIECDECSKKRLSEDLMDEISLEKYRIPQEYRNKIFYVTNLDKYEGKVDNDKFLEFKRTLSGIFRKIESGGIIKNSYYIHIDDLDIEYNFVFACIQAALKRGLTVTPYIDTMELDFLTVNAIQPDRNKETAKRINFPIDSFYTVDYCFIKLNELMSKETSIRNIHLLKDLLDRRARQDKPTILLSSKPYNYMKAVDSKFTSEFLVTQKVAVGYNKFLYISMYGVDL